MASRTVVRVTVAVRILHNISCVCTTDWSWYRVLSWTVIGLLVQNLHHLIAFWGVRASLHPILLDQSAVFVKTMTVMCVVLLCGPQCFLHDMQYFLVYPTFLASWGCGSQWSPSCSFLQPPFALIMLWCLLWLSMKLLSCSWEHARGLLYLWEWYSPSSHTESATWLDTCTTGEWQGWCHPRAPSSLSLGKPLGCSTRMEASWGSC